MKVDLGILYICDFLFGICCGGQQNQCESSSFAVSKQTDGGNREGQRERETFGNFCPVRHFQRPQERIRTHIYIYIYIYIYKSKCGVASGTIHIKDIIYVEKEQHKRARLPLGFYSPKGTLYL